MFKNISIKGKLTSLILFLVVVAVCTSGFISYSIRKNMLQEKNLQNLSALANVKKDNILRFVQTSKEGIEVVSKQENFQSINKIEISELTYITIFISKNIIWIDDSCVRIIACHRIPKRSLPINTHNQPLFGFRLFDTATNVMPIKTSAAVKSNLAIMLSKAANVSS